MSEAARIAELEKALAEAQHRIVDLVALCDSNQNRALEAQQARDAANQRWIAAADHAEGLARERDTLRGLLREAKAKLYRAYLDDTLTSGLALELSERITAVLKEGQ